MNELAEKLTCESLLIEMADMMIPRTEATLRVEKWRAVKDRRWLIKLYEMESALICLKRIGYAVTELYQPKP